MVLQKKKILEIIMHVILLLACVLWAVLKSIAVVFVLLGIVVLIAIANNLIQDMIDEREV